MRIPIHILFPFKVVPGVQSSQSSAKISKIVLTRLEGETTRIEKLYRNSINMKVNFNIEKADFATCRLAASLRYVRTLEQCYHSSNIISYWVSHRHNIPYQRMDP